MQPVGSVLVGKRGAPCGLYRGWGTISDVLGLGRQSLGSSEGKAPCTFVVRWQGVELLLGPGVSGAVSCFTPSSTQPLFAARRRAANAKSGRSQALQRL